MMYTAEGLNESHGIAGELEFKIADHGALVAEIANAYGAGEVAIQGAQILTWAPAGSEPVVWLSAAAKFKEGKPLRGGAPVCWPWFGPHPTDADKPGHGFARSLDWTVEQSVSVAGGTRIVLRFVPGEAQKAMSPQDAELTRTVTMGERLYAELTTRNNGSDPIGLTQALHTYFHVGDIAAVRVDGLEGAEYIDKLSDDAMVCQEGPIRIDREVNRIYLGCPADGVIVDQSLRRRIRVAKQGSASYVVWNPWAETGAKFGDMGEDGYRKMLCVETTNAATDTVSVPPGGSYTLVTELSVEPL